MTKSLIDIQTSKKNENKRIEPKMQKRIDKLRKDTWHLNRKGQHYEYDYQDESSISPTNQNSALNFISNLNHTNNLQTQILSKHQEIISQ